jgi:selenocysteine lyase/cysteine desulfurase
VAPPPARSPHLVGLGMPDRLDPGVVAAHLAERRVHVSVRGASIRISAHLWNTPDDADRLVAALAEL